MQLAASELILNENGSIYHCNLLPENLADTVILVGDPDRVAVISQFFDSIEFKSQKREIVCHTGTFRNKRLTVISTGMGTDNIDIVLNELDAVANIDLKLKKENENFKQLTFIRLGTSGALQTDIQVDSILASSHGLGFDGLMYYYQNSEAFSENAFIENFIKEVSWNPNLSKPYLVPANNDLLEKAKSIGINSGVTATATGFYGPQGRELRLGLSDKLLNEKLSKISFENLRITNFEMETSAIYGLAHLMGHKALSINCIVANRFLGLASKDSHAAIEKMILKILNEFI